MISLLADDLATKPPEEAMREMTKLGDANSVSRIQSLGPTQAIADIRQVAEIEREFANRFESTEANQREWMADLEAGNTINPFVGIFFFADERVVSTTQAATVKNALAAAGLAVIENGLDALQSHSDPATGQPFTYTQTADGFDLESRFQFREKPLKLSFK